jgi:integrase
MKGEGRVYKRGGVWWADYTVHGHRIRTSTGKATEREATQWLRQRVIEAASGMAPEADKVTLAELVQSYLMDSADHDTVKWYRSRWERHLEPFFGNVKACKVSTDLMRQYIQKRQTERDGKGGTQPANGTINRELAILSGALQLGKREGKVRAIPYIPRLREDNVRKGFLKDEQHSKLADETAKVGLWLRAIFEVGYTFGWRESEILGLKVERVNLAERTMRLETGETKNDEGREVSVPSSLFALVSACCAGKQPGEHVFTREDKPVLDFSKAWRNCCKAAGVPDLLFHDLRRTAVRNMVRSGIPERVAMRISGHKTRAIFDRYHIVAPEDLKEAAAKMERFGTVVAQTASLDGAKSHIN